MLNNDEALKPARWTPSNATPCENGGFIAYGDYLRLVKLQAKEVERIKAISDAHIAAEQTIAQQKKRIDQLSQQVVDIGVIVMQSKPR